MRAWALVVLLIGVALAGCIGGSDDDGNEEPLQKARASVTRSLGGIEGLVTDTAVQPISGANVTIAELNQTTRTQQDGSFAFSELEPGSYTVTVSVRGFISAAEEVVVVANEAALVDFILAALALQEAFTQAWELAGFFECGFGAGYDLSALPAPANISGGLITIAACAIVGITPETENATNDRFSHLIHAEAPIHALVVETVWDPQLAGASDQLWVDVVPRDHPCGTIVTCEQTFLDHWGPAPLRGEVNRSRFEHVQAYYDQQCADGEDSWCGYSYFDSGWPLLLRVFPRWECTPAGPQACVLAQQTFDHVVTAFYNQDAPVDFSALSG